MNCTGCQLITGWLPNLQDPIMVCETWWTDQSVTNIKGFNLFRTDREHSRGSGVCMYITDLVKSYQVNEKCLLDKSIEIVWFSIEIGWDNILCGCI
jgi:hypothetical protein